MPTFYFMVKITTGKRTDLDVKVRSRATSNLPIHFKQSEESSSCSLMERKLYTEVSEMLDSHVFFSTDE